MHLLLYQLLYSSSFVMMAENMLAGRGERPSVADASRAFYSLPILVLAYHLLFVLAHQFLFVLAHQLLFVLAYQVLFVTNFLLMASLTIKQLSFWLCNAC